MSNLIDARGLACPEPVLLTKKALASQPKTISVLVDNNIAKENVTRFAKNAGYQVQCNEDKNTEEYTLILTH